MRRPGSAVGRQAFELAFVLDDLGVGRHDLGRLTMQAQADLVGLVRILLHRRLDAAHDELEMREIVALVFVDHQKFVLLRRATM